MYIFKNALKCISRAKDRNILIGVIVLVIAISSCIGLSIRQAAESTKEETLADLSVTANISFDRASAMKQAVSEQGEQGFDRSEFKKMMDNTSAISLDEYLTYAEAESVKDFYYSMTAYVNGANDFEPVSTETGEETAADNGDPSANDSDAMGGKGNRVPGFNSDFSIMGYSSETAMTSFTNGDASITDGAMFDISKKDSNCIISQELASFNDLSAGDSISISNPNNEDELYKLTVSGIYSNSSANSESFSKFGSTSTDPVNQILVSYKTLESITASSAAAAEKSTDEEDTSSEISGNLAATYVLENVDAYEAFEKEVRELGLDDKYVITSPDLASFENSLTPLNTLSTIAGYFLLVILIIGAVILVVLNIFNVRERKYEIGVLTAMGMKKGKVALQFLTEIFVITLVAVIIGIGVGAVSSVPVTNALLENQVASQTAQTEQIEQNFGRGQGDQMNLDNGKKFTEMRGMNQETDYVTEISSAMNLTVVLQLFIIGLILTLIASAVSMLFVMRYDPLKILANRD